MLLTLFLNRKFGLGYILVEICFLQLKTSIIGFSLNSS